MSLFEDIASSSLDNENFRCERHAENSLSGMQNYLQERRLCDITLIAGNDGKRVLAHRLVLSAASEYFSAMFTGNFRETGEAEITLDDVSGDILEAIVNYCYSGAIEIRKDNVETLLPTARLFLLHDVAEACSRFLVRQLHPSNCFSIAKYAEHHVCDSLWHWTMSFINCHFMKVIDTPKFLELSLDQIRNLLSSDDLRVTSERHVFKALMSWIQHDSDTRRVHIANLLALVKLPLLEPAFLMDHVQNAVGSDPACQSLIVEAMNWHFLPEQRSGMSSSRTRPRKGTSGKLIVLGKNSETLTIESYDHKSNTWTYEYLVKSKRSGFGIALMEDKLLVVGGYYSISKPLNTMECLDMTTRAWTQLSPMNTKRSWAGVAVLNGLLYVVGGYNGQSILNTVERWDPVTQCWSYVAPMQCERTLLGVAVLDGKLYAVGGTDDDLFSSSLSTVECYEPQANKWTLCASMAKSRHGIGVVAANGFLYAMGGQNCNSKFACVEKYNPGTDAWTFVANMSCKRSDFAACLFGDQIIAAGGYDRGYGEDSEMLNIVEQYDPIRNKWNLLAPLTTGRAEACAISVPSHQTLDR